MLSALGLYGASKPKAALASLFDLFGMDLRISGPDAAAISSSSRSNRAKRSDLAASLAFFCSSSFDLLVRLRIISNELPAAPALISRFRTFFVPIFFRRRSRLDARDTSSSCSPVPFSPLGCQDWGSKCCDSFGLNLNVFVAGAAFITARGVALAATVSEFSSCDVPSAMIAGRAAPVFLLLSCSPVFASDASVAFETVELPVGSCFEGSSSSIFSLPSLMDGITSTGW
mmetsp:Transcript_16795/g.47066  ORF Transcript_16795/g.47066 Transcript_16795/m.47066 type:complete len:229 (-) Transcript_16795:422-1108(-)